MFDVVHNVVMAGGMTRGREHPSMAQRVAQTRRSTGACPARHCWVADTADGDGVKRPGLLVEWRLSTAGLWEGRVIYSAELRNGRWGIVEEWVGADLLLPA